MQLPVSPSPGRHVILHGHWLAVAVIHAIGIHAAMLLALLSFSVEMIVSPILLLVSPEKWQRGPAVWSVWLVQGPGTQSSTRRATGPPPPSGHGRPRHSDDEREAYFEVYSAGRITNGVC
jgi:hypothetical protein